MATMLDKFGRVIIPKIFRERLGINFKSTLNISEDGKRIVIELVHEKEPVVNRNGILVYTGNLENKKSSALGGLIEFDRNRRINRLLANED